MAECFHGMISIMRNACRILFCLLPLIPGIACTQPYPVKPIRWIVTFPAGGVTDIIGRTLAVRLTDTLGQQVVIDNRGGAGGVIGTEMVARAAPDGYTWLFGTSGGLSINPAFASKLPYDPQRDFAPVSLMVEIGRAHV